MAGERRGQARRTEVKQRGEMREETRRGGMWRRGMGRRGNYKEGEVGGGFWADVIRKRRVFNSEIKTMTQ